MIFLKQNINKIILGIIIILLLVLLLMYFSREKEYIKSFDDLKTIKIYTNGDPKKIYAKIEPEKDSDKIKEILKQEGIEKFILNNNGNITAGKHYNSEKYLVSIMQDNKVKDIVSLENESMYIYETDDILIAAINETLAQAKEDIADYLNNKKINEEKTIYILEKEKIITDNFKKHLK